MVQDNGYVKSHRLEREPEKSKNVVNDVQIEQENFMPSIGAERKRVEKVDEEDPLSRAKREDFER